MNLRNIGTGERINLQGNGKHITIGGGLYVPPEESEYWRTPLYSGNNFNDYKWEGKHYISSMTGGGRKASIIMRQGTDKSLSCINGRTHVPNILMCSIPFRPDDSIWHDYFVLYNPVRVSVKGKNYLKYDTTGYRVQTMSTYIRAAVCLLLQIKDSTVDKIEPTNNILLINWQYTSAVHIDVQNRVIMRYLHNFDKINSILIYDSQNWFYDQKNPQNMKYEVNLDNIYFAIK